MSASVPRDVLARFPTGTTANDAATYLRAADNDVSAAVKNYNTDQQKKKKPAAQGDQTYFVGGGSSSGQAVVSPNVGSSNNAQRASATSNSTTDAIENVFSKARENGARDTTDAPENGAGSIAFAGVGRRLGHLEGQSPVMPASKRFEKRVRITFYENGFQVDDGPLRSFTDELGVRFLESVNRGFIPRELVSQYGDVDLSIDLVDRREEEYAPPPPPAYVAFSGTGRTLSNGETKAPSSAPSSSFPASTAAATVGDVVVDETQPTSHVIIVGLTGQRFEVTVNPGRHTVRDLKTLASRQQQGIATNAFDLIVRDVPPRTLTDDAVTIEAARCQKAIVMMKKK